MARATKQLAAAPGRTFSRSPGGSTIRWLVLTTAFLAGCGPSVDPPETPSPTERPLPPEVALHVAALAGDLDVVRQHVGAGLDLNAVDAYGSTPLTVATTFGRTDVALALIEAGADLAIGDAQGSTPLHLAAFFGRVPIVEALLEQGADRYARNDDGATAFDLVVTPFQDDRGIYDQIQAGLGPLGLQLDYDRIQAARPVIADMLRPSAGDLETIDYRPRGGGRWELSTPSAEGVDPELIAELFRDAAELEALHGLLVVKNGRLIAEGYFGEGSVGEEALLQSVTKSFTSASVGLALARGCIRDVDQRMVEFFPDVADGITDPRKREITIRQMLQMRAGYPWEETDSTLWESFIAGDYLPLVAEVPLSRDPGTGFEYSNITSHLLGVIVARACDTDLLDLARDGLFAPLGVEPGPWLRDPYGYRYGHAELRLRARDLARFGVLYLDRGAFGGRRVLPAEWVEASLGRYSSDISGAGVRAGRLGRYFRDVGYGYQWWSARVGAHAFEFAWGHGGQLVILLDDLDMVVVVTSDPFHRPVRQDAESWRHERANFNLVGKFIQSLPG